LLVERALAAGHMDPIHHARTRPEILEAEATSRSVRLAELAGAGVYIVHVTCGLAADEIAAGQARGVADATAKLKELESIGVDQFNVYLMTKGQEETLKAYGDEIIPQFSGVTA